MEEKSSAIEVDQLRSLRKQGGDQGEEDAVERIITVTGKSWV